MAECIFCKIIDGEIPSFKVYEDDLVLSFADINPVAEGHTLIIPKKHAKNLWEIDDLYDGRLLGFFSFSPGQTKEKKIRAPWACGKMFLLVIRNEDGTASFRATRVEFDDDFSLKEIKIRFLH